MKQPGHLTSMKNDRGPGTRVLSLCLRVSAWGEGLRRSTARTYGNRIIVSDTSMYMKETNQIDGVEKLFVVSRVLGFRDGRLTILKKVETVPERIRRVCCYREALLTCCSLFRRSDGACELIDCDSELR